MLWQCCGYGQVGFLQLSQPTSAVQKWPDVGLKIYCGFTLANVYALSWTVVFGLLVLLRAHKHHHPLDLFTWKSAHIHITCNDTYSNIYKYIFIYRNVDNLRIQCTHLNVFVCFFPETSNTNILGLGWIFPRATQLAWTKGEGNEKTPL